MSWLGASGFSRDAMQSLGAAYASVGQPTQEEMFESWLDERLEEGADLSEFTTDEVYDYYVHEVLEEGKKPSREERAAAHRDEKKYADEGESNEKSDTIKKAEERQKAPEADKKGTKQLKRREMRKGEGLGVGARKRQGVGKVSPENADHGGPVQFQHYEYDGEGRQLDENDILAALQDAYSMMYEKKKDSDKCGEGTYWDKEEKKCKKKKSSSSKTVIVSRGGGYYGGHLGHGHGGGGGSNGGGDTDTDGGDGGDGGGDGGGGGE
jgi:hypothetical protein